MKKQIHLQFENTIKTALNDKAEKISVQDNMFENIKHEINLNRSEKNYMLKAKYIPLSFKKYTIAACCSLFVAAGSVLAFSPSIRVEALQCIDRYVNGYTSMKSYDKIPSKDDLKKTLGYDIKVPSSLEGGYNLSKIHILGHVDGLMPSKQNDKSGVTAIYSKYNIKNKYIALQISKPSTEEDSPVFKNAKAITIGNTTAYWTEYKIHNIPKEIMDKKTQNEQDEINKASENGTEILVITSNRDNQKLNEEFLSAHALRWTDNNIVYNIIDDNCSLTFEEILKAAEYIINSK